MLSQQGFIDREASGYLVLRGIGLPVVVPLTAIRAVQDAVRRHKVLVFPDGGAGGDDAWKRGGKRGDEAVLLCFIICTAATIRPGEEGGGGRRKMGDGRREDATTVGNTVQHFMIKNPKTTAENSVFGK